MKHPSTFLFIFLFPSINCSFCGQTSIPFTFQALRSGQPVLGCARPRCFGWPLNGTSGEPPQFYRIRGKEDGYMRKREEGVDGGSPDTSSCALSFSSSSCGIGQWIGGIAPQSDPSSPLKLRCCSYGPLLQSEDRGIATVKSGQLVVGGEVKVEGKVVAFDYIADMTRSIKEDGSVVYNVALRRMSCFDTPLPVSSVADSSLQNVVETHPKTYSPWEEPKGVRTLDPTSSPTTVTFPPFTMPSIPQQTRPFPSTQYPGQPQGIQPEPLESSKPTDIQPVPYPPQPSIPHPYQSVQGQVPQSGVQYPPSTGVQYPPQSGVQYPPQTATQYPSRHIASHAVQSPQYPPSQPSVQYPPNQSIQYPPSQGIPQVPQVPYAPQVPPNSLLGMMNPMIPFTQQLMQQSQGLRQPPLLSTMTAPQGPSPQEEHALQQVLSVQNLSRDQETALHRALLKPLTSQQEQALRQAALNAGQDPDLVIAAQRRYAQQAVAEAAQPQVPALPKLEQLPKLNIPSIEDVENAIPPVEKAILTTVARFFGVL